MLTPQDESNTHWFYNRCSTARAAMETPLSTLQLSIKVLQFIKSIDEDADDVSQIEVFNLLKGDDIKAKKRDFSFIIDVCERAIDLRDEEDFSEKALREVAEENGDETEPVSSNDNEMDGNNSINSDAEELGGKIVSTRDVSNSTTHDIDTTDNINFDELHCFQLRTRVLGLNIKFSELWKYLQIAGWTYVGGIYHIPKGKRQSTKYGAEGMAKKIYKHFNIDETKHNNQNGGKQTHDGDESDDDVDEEGPETFSNSNDLVEYLDEFAMPDYRATSAEIHAQQATLSTKSHAYKRRNIRLRFELLEVAYRERLPKSHSELKSKYGHNHRPCEVCFKGANQMYPRVACCGCGMVVHTHCYGLLDHGEKRGSCKGDEVDEKGLFTCDICSSSVIKSNDKLIFNAPTSARWRVHEHPNATCQLCDRKEIAGGMVRILIEEGATGSNNRKRKSRRSTVSDSSETCVHLYCINTLRSGTLSTNSIRSSSSAVLHIRNAVEKASEVLRETESMREKSIRCERCGNRSGVLVECTGSCGTFYHRLCLQISCLDGVDWNAKKEHLCLRCRKIDITSSPDESITYAIKATENAPKIKPTTSNARKGKLDEVEQYFGRKSFGGKKSSNDEGIKKLVVPTQKECIAEVEALYRQSNADLAFEEFELQYKQHFYEWSFSLATNQSILLYGLGSKISLLNSFGQYLAQEGDVMSINGYDPRVNLSQLLDYMDQIFCDRSAMQHGNLQIKCSRKGLPKKAASVAKAFASKRSRPLFILIHNIDGAGLCNPYAQDAIATLSANSKKDGSQLIRIVSSVDNVNAAMVLFSPQVEHKFDWAWKKVHTYRPYIEEVKCMPQTEESKKVKKRKGTYVGADSAALKVLASLAPRHTEALQALASLQLANSSNPVSFTSFRDECRKKMVTSSDVHLRNILKELSSHNIVESKKDTDGSEIVFVPEGIPINDVLKWNRPI